MKKKFLALFCVLFLTIPVFAGCSQNVVPQTLRVAALAGPTGMGMAPMMVNGVDCGKNVSVAFSIETAPEQVVAAVVNGDYEIAAVPTNVAATLYNKTNGGVLLGAVNTLGTLSIIGNKGEQITKISDLKGKTIGATGQGTTPEVVFDYLLSESGLDIDKDVSIIWYGEHAEAAASLAAGNISIAVLPEPFATATLAKNEDLTKVLDLDAEWRSVSGMQLPMGCVVINRDWAESNPTVLKKFMKAYADSVALINAADEAAGQMIQDAGIMEKAALAQKAIPNCAITFMTPKEAKADLNAYYELLANFDAKTIGGKVPDDAFYSLIY